MWPFHKHQFKTIRAERYVLQKIGPFLEGDVTILLQKCSCGKVRTEQIDGHWKSEELTSDILGLYK